MSNFRPSRCGVTQKIWDAFLWELGRRNMYVRSIHFSKNLWIRLRTGRKTPHLLVTICADNQTMGFSLNKDEIINHKAFFIGYDAGRQVDFLLSPPKKGGELDNAIRFLTA